LALQSPAQLQEQVDQRLRRQVGAAHAFGGLSRQREERRQARRAMRRRPVQERAARTISARPP
jgi:hypothetical protein